ncbi:unnamed protein product [Zymoseptoria tritici ST99CH_3D1]|nr:unnamed protein product [Zymoseptoria tritici ST99CH_3D1]
MTFPLPPARENQVYVTVSPLAGGYITLADHFFVSPAEPNAARTVPSLSFLIKHPGPNKFSSKTSRPFHLMFDLGLRRSKDRYPSALQAHLERREPHHLEPGVAAQLSAGGLDPGDVDMVILSHVHYDHHGDPEDFPNAQFRVGNGALDVLEHGLGAGGSHQHFVPGTLPANRTEEFSDPAVGGEWKSMRPFPATLELFDDGSVMKGERWVLLCGDAFHDRRLLTGEKEIGRWEGEGGRMLCIHYDEEGARRSIGRLREWDRVTEERSTDTTASIDGYHPSTPWPKNLAEFDIEADILVEQSFDSRTPQLSPAAYDDQSFSSVMDTQPETVAGEEIKPTPEDEGARGNPFVTLLLAEERPSIAGSPVKEEEAKVEAVDAAPMRAKLKDGNKGIMMRLPIRGKKQ